MKKLLSILLALLMLSFMLFACDKDNDITNTDATSSSEETSSLEDDNTVYPTPSVMSKCENGCCDIILGGKYLGNDFKDSSYDASYKLIKTYEELISLVEYGNLVDEAVFEEYDVLVVYNQSSKKASCFDSLSIGEGIARIVENSYKAKEETGEISYVIIPKKDRIEGTTGELYIEEFLPTVFIGTYDDVDGEPLLEAWPNDDWYEQYDILYTSYDEFMFELGNGIEFGEDFNESIFEDNYLVIAHYETGNMGYTIRYYDFEYNESDNSITLGIYTKPPKGPWVLPATEDHLSIIPIRKSLFPENIEEIKDEIVIK